MLQQFLFVFICFFYRSYMLLLKPPVLMHYLTLFRRLNHYSFHTLPHVPCLALQVQTRTWTYMRENSNYKKKYYTPVIENTVRNHPSEFQLSKPQNYDILLCINRNFSALYRNSNSFLIKHFSHPNTFLVPMYFQCIYTMQLSIIILPTILTEHNKAKFD